MSQAEQALILAQRSEIERLRPNLKPSQYYWQLNEKSQNLLLVRRVGDHYGVLLHSSNRWLSRTLSFVKITSPPLIVDNSGIICTGGFGTMVYLWTANMPPTDNSTFEVQWSSYQSEYLRIQMNSLRSSDITLPRDVVLQLITEFCAILRDHLDESDTYSLETLAQFEQACRNLGANPC